MPSVLAYHRPESLEEASTLLAGANRRALGGGTVVVPAVRERRGEGVEFVDLQALGLDQIESADGRVTMGAMVRLGELVTDDRVPRLLRELAQRELPSALRNQATLGGTIALAEPESVLLAGLLVHEARVELTGHGSVLLAELLEQGTGNGIITSVSVAADGHGAIASTARTPADVPIVAAIARSTPDGMRLALTGVAATPVEVDPADPAADLSPPGDFRGSTAYRAHLAALLSKRVLAEVES